MELVVERGMDIRGDSLVELPGALTAEQQVVPAQRRAAHPELLAAVRHALTVFHRQACDADRGLPVAPPLVMAAEGSVVAVPRRDRASVELRENLWRDRLAAVRGVHRVPKSRELLHRNRVEADAVARATDVMGERREHRLLPLAVLALPLAVTNSECGVVRRGVAERPVAEEAADDQLHLILGERILLDGDENLVTFLDLPCLSLAFRCEDHMVRGAGELALAGPAAGLDLELEPFEVEAG